MGIPGKGLTTYMDIKTKIPNKKQKEKLPINEITDQNLRKLLEKLKK